MLRACAGSAPNGPMPTNRAPPSVQRMQPSLRVRLSVRLSVRACRPSLSATRLRLSVGSVRLLLHLSVMCASKHADHLIMCGIYSSSCEPDLAMHAIPQQRTGFLRAHPSRIHRIQTRVSYIYL